jgi:hypothetical protein
MLTTSWMKIDKQPVPADKRASANEIYLRGVWTMELSFVEACDVMFSFDARRALWDANSKGAEVVSPGVRPARTSARVIIFRLNLLRTLGLAWARQRCSARSVRLPSVRRPV